LISTKNTVYAAMEFSRCVRLSNRRAAARGRSLKTQQHSKRRGRRYSRRAELPDGHCMIQFCHLRVRRLPE